MEMFFGRCQFATRKLEETQANLDQTLAEAAGYGAIHPMRRRLK